MIWVFIGGGVGSLVRYGLQLVGGPKTGIFPFATLVANVVACLVLGFMTVILLQKPESRTLGLLLTTGFCGGLSTFSTLMQEFLLIWWNGDFKFGVLYLFLSITIGLAAVSIGFLMGNLFLNQQHGIG